MLLYFPLGVLTAWLLEWTPPQTGQEKRLAILFPSLVAWVWVCVVLVSIAGQWEALFAAVFIVSFFFAAPSSLFTIALAAVFSWRRYTGLSVILGFFGLVAGFLPPLLFALGSFWQSRRMGKKVTPLV